MGFKKILSILIMLVFKCASIYSQGNDIKNRALLIVAVDFTDANLNMQEDFFSNYSIVTLKSKGIDECTFFKIKPSCKDASCDCNYYLVYSNYDKRFYKLVGFKNSEFAEFYNRVLLGGAITFYEKMKNHRKKLDYIYKNTQVEELNFLLLYDVYCLNDRNSAFDTSSCFRKTRITAY